MDYQTPDTQRTKSLETMEIYAPIAHRLGMQQAKWELEDLALRYLDPTGYREITAYLDSRMADLEGFMSAVDEKIQTRLESEGIQASIFSRIKHVYSIYRKMYAQKLDINGIFDLCAFRVIVDSLPDCYNVLGVIHDMFKPVPGRFKDYISTPKPNMYQSLHTTVIGAARASPSRCRSAPGRCTTPPNTASPPTGSTRWTAAAAPCGRATRKNSPGSVTCWRISRSPTPRTSSMI